MKPIFRTLSWVYHELNSKEFHSSEIGRLRTKSFCVDKLLRWIFNQINTSTCDCHKRNRSLNCLMNDLCYLFTISVKPSLAQDKLNMIFSREDTSVAFEFVISNHREFTITSVVWSPPLSVWFVNRFHIWSWLIIQTK